MEKDDEIKGKVNSYDFGARLLDPRVGRWLSRDPLEAKYTGITPYSVSLNSPVLLKDPDGREVIIVDPETGESTIYVPHSTHISENASDFVKTVISTLDAIIDKGWDDEINIISKLSESKDFNVSIKKEGNWRKALGSVTGSISWSPNSGLAQTEGGDEIRQSPAASLFHELSHVAYEMLDPYGEMANEPDPKLSFEEWNQYLDKQLEDAGEYDVLSDKWIITQIEKNIDGDKRKTHSGDSKERFFTSDVFGTTGPKVSDSPPGPMPKVYYETKESSVESPRL